MTRYYTIEPLHTDLGDVDPTQVRVCIWESAGAAADYAASLMGVRRVEADHPLAVRARSRLATTLELQWRADIILGASDGRT